MRPPRSVRALLAVPLSTSCVKFRMITVRAPRAGPFTTTCLKYRTNTHNHGPGPQTRA